MDWTESAIRRKAAKGRKRAGGAAMAKVDDKETGALVRGHKALGATCEFAPLCESCKQVLPHCPALAVKAKSGT